MLSIYFDWFMLLFIHIIEFDEIGILSGNAIDFSL